MQCRNHPALHVSSEKCQIGKVCILGAYCLHSSCFAVRNVRVQLHSGIAQMMELSLMLQPAVLNSKVPLSGVDSFALAHLGCASAGSFHVLRHAGSWSDVLCNGIGTSVL